MQIIDFETDATRRGRPGKGKGRRPLRPGAAVLAACILALAPPADVTGALADDAGPVDFTVELTPGGPVDLTPGGPVDLTPGGPVDLTPGGTVDLTPGGTVVTVETHEEPGTVEVHEEPAVEVHQQQQPGAQICFEDQQGRRVCVSGGGNIFGPDGIFGGGLFGN